jgi:hypothetical protein
MQDNADPRPGQLAALGYQPVFCVLRAANPPQHPEPYWSPLTGTTGGAPWGGAADAESLAGRPYRLALRPPPDVLIIDVDDHDGTGLGPATIARMTAELGPLPPTWRLTARGPGQGTGRYLYRIPDDLVVTDAALWPFGRTVTGQDGRTRVETGIEVVRTGHRFSWAEGDVHPGTGTPVVVYGPDGAPCPMPAVRGLPWLP